MGKIQLNTSNLWEIGKKVETIQHQTYSLAASLENAVHGLNVVEDILQWTDEKVAFEAWQMRKQADRCGLAASYIFKIAENYEQAETAIINEMANIISEISRIRSVNDEIHAEYCELTDEEKLRKALDMEYSQQNSKEAANIDYPGGDRDNDGKVNDGIHDTMATADKSACGSYALLHALRYLSKSKGLTIQEICEIAVESGARPKTTTGGTYINKLGEALSEKGYDVEVSDRYYSYEDALKELKNGNAVVASYPNDRFHNWSDGGRHFVALVDISEDGQRVLVVDSDTRNLKYDDNKDGVFWVDISKLKGGGSFYTVS